jgi:hypothetical protein
MAYQPKGTLMAYVDESGDTGSYGAGGSLTYTLGVLLLGTEDWNETFDKILGFRREIKERYGIPMRAEIKANTLIRGEGDLKKSGLTPQQRADIYLRHLTFLSENKIRTFAVVGHKGSALSGQALMDAVWIPTLQRLERTSRSWRNLPVLLVHDETENHVVRSIARKSRRQMIAGSAYDNSRFKVPFSKFIDDPVPRKSHESYYLQFADLVAYAAWRRIYVPSRNVAKVAPTENWDRLRSSVLNEVTSVSYRTTGGIVEVNI